MLLFDWKKIYETAQGDVYTCNLIMSMLIKGSVPKNTTRLKVQYTNRKGNFIDRWIRIPMGREKKLGR